MGRTVHGPGAGIVKAQSVGTGVPCRRTRDHGQWTSRQGVTSMYTISTDRERLDLDRIVRWLSKESYWAQERTREAIERSIEHSLVFGAYLGDEQVGLARAVTDFSTFAWLCDVFVDTDAPRPRGGEAPRAGCDGAPRAVRAAPDAARDARCSSALRNVRRLPRSADSGTLDGPPRRKRPSTLRELGLVDLGAPVREHTREEPVSRAETKSKAPRHVGQR